jgi:hypothetical protein
MRSLMDSAAQDSGARGWPCVIGVAAILALAALLRFQNLHAIEHNVDHAYPVWQALTTLERGAWPVTAQGTSVLFANPALTGYLYVLPVALARSPLGPYLLVIMLNTLGVWFAYRAGALLIGAPRALIAAFLLAINPWVIEYSRTTWVQALLPCFAPLVLWLLAPVWLGRARHPARRTLIAMAALTAMTQTYLLAFMALVPVALLTLIFRRAIPWRAAAIGGALFLAATGVYGLGLAARGEETIARVQSFSEGGARLSDEAWSHAVRLVTGREYAVARGLEAPMDDWQTRHTLSEAAHVALLAALLAGMIGAGWQVYRRREAPGRAARAAIMLVWFGAPILLMSYVSRPVHPFYLLLTLPAGHALAAQGIGAGWALLRRWLGRRSRLAEAIPAVGALAAVAVSMLFGLNTLRYAEATLATPGAHDLSALPVGAGIEMARTLFPPETRPPGAVIFADVDEWTLNSFAGALFPVDRDIDTAHTTYIPAAGGLYLFFAPPDAPVMPPPPLGAQASGQVALADGASVTRYPVDGSLIPAWAQGETISGDAGISFLGTALEGALNPGESTALVTAWRVDALLPERGGWLFGPFAHAFDAEGNRIAIADGAVTPGAAWRQGDVHLKRITITLPAGAAGPFALRAGLYDGVHQRGVIFSLPDGSHSDSIPIAVTPSDR